MLLSVVINTYNRAASLKVTLESLKHQTSKNFEVIVVNGPSTDETSIVLQPFINKIKIIPCNVRNLSVSRNLGIEAASGDVVAFIDDDAIADPNWVQDLLAGYDQDDVGGVGGLVYDHTGMRLQYHYSACDRKGDTDFTICPPFDKYNISGAEKFLYLQGTNCSFRRQCLEAIGGFDEEFEYYLDEVDVCMRIVDLGYKMKPTDNAIVHHKYMKSFLRNEKRVVLHPYSTVKNKYYFAYQNATEDKLESINNELSLWLDGVKSGGDWNLAQGNMSKEDWNIYQEEVKQACIDGKVRGKEKRKTRKLTMASKEKFLPFDVIDAPEKRLKICYLSREYPPNNFGGIGRYTYDLATTFAKYGHEVHVITEGTIQDTVDFEEGVWVHRIVNQLYKPVENLTLGWNISLILRNYFEVKRINDIGKIDLINGPIWLSETVACNDLMQIPTVVTLMTTQRILNNMTDITDVNSHEYKMMKLEEITLKHHQYVHAISESIKANCKEFISEQAYSFIAPLGCRDLSCDYVKNKDKNEIRILSVGRLEHRKGTDLLLQAAENILAKYNNVRFIFIGKDTENTETGIPYRIEFQKKHRNNEKILKHVEFLGEVSEDILMQCYKDADICCTPSRYESFGIVLLEGMSFSNAIVAANIGGMKGILDNERNGLLFETENVDELECALVKLINNDLLRKNLASQAREDYLNKYSLDAVYRTLYSEYCNIINQFKKDSSIGGNWAEVISYAENISLERANVIVKELEKNKAEVVENTDESNNLKRCYYLVKKFSPRMAYRIKNAIFPYYLESRGSKLNRKIYLMFKLLYHCLKKLPIVGLVIRYIGDIVLMPLKIEQIMTYNENKLLGLENKLLDLKEIIDYNNLKNKELQENLDVCAAELGNLKFSSRQIETKMDSEIKAACVNTRNLIEKFQDNLFNNLLGYLDSSKRELYTNWENSKKDILNNDELLKQISLIGTVQNKQTISDFENLENHLFNKINDRLSIIRSEILFEFGRKQYLTENDIEGKNIKIINPEKIETMQSKNYVAVNLGAGHICFDNYINIDERELLGIDVVSDIRQLPFEKNSVNEIYAAHVVEHFEIREFTKTILPYWTSLLKKGGKLTVIIPDLEGMIQKYNEQTYSISDMREVIFGLQEYVGDIHYALYGRDELKEILEANGYTVTFEFLERHNGKCYDMGLVGIKYE